MTNLRTKASSCTLASGETVCIPPLEIVLPTDLHPDSDAVEQRLAIDDRPYALALFGSEKATDAYMAHRIPVYGGLSYPHGLKARMYSAQRSMNAIGLMDEEFAGAAMHADPDRRLERREHYLSAISGIRPSAAAPAAQLLFDTIEPIKRDLESKPRVCRRLLDSIRAQIECLCTLTDREVEELTVESFLTVRRIEVFGEWVAMLTEYALDVDMTDTLEGNESLRAVRTLSIDLIGFINDYFSFRKEAGEKGSLNCIWVLMREQGLSLQEAVNRLVSMCHEYERDLFAAHDRVLAGALGTRCDVRDYATELPYLSSATFAFPSYSTRYHGRDAQGRSVLSGEMTLMAMPSLEEIALADPMRRARP